MIEEIKKRINTTNTNYDGFDMSGYDNSQLHNMEILGRFKDLIKKEDNRHGTIIIPVFWKGKGNLIKIDQSSNSTILEDITAQTTEDIIYKILKYYENGKSKKI